jgi:uncharacterized protein YndB with AHSA1/START domain
MADDRRVNTGNQPSRDEGRHAPGFRPPAPGAAGETGETGDTGKAATEASGDDVRDRDVRRRVVLEATPDEVWRALTHPDELAAWWGEGTELDATPGGEGHFEEDGEPPRRARVVESRPGRRLVLDWWPEDPEDDEPASRVTIELVPCPFGTIVTVVECVLLDLSELPVLVTPRPTFLPRMWGRGPQARTLVGV